MSSGHDLDHICTMPLAYAPRSTVLYTDLGLILMGVAMEQRTGKTLDVLVDDPCAVENVSRFAGSQGYTVTVTEDGADFKLSLKK